jgi:hypothetical protein
MIAKKKIGYSYVLNEKDAWKKTSDAEFEIIYNVLLSK